MVLLGPVVILRRRRCTPLQYFCLENPMDGGAWWAVVHGVTKSRTWLSDFPFTFHFPALEKEMATHSSVLAWRIPGTGEPGGLLSMGSHRVRHDWRDLAPPAAAAYPSPGDLPDLGMELRSPALQADSLPIELWGKPKNTGVGSLSLLQWSSWPRNQTGVSCIAGGFFTNWAIREAPGFWWFDKNKQGCFLYYFLFKPYLNSIKNNPCFLINIYNFLEKNNPYVLKVL